MVYPGQSFPVPVLHYHRSQIRHGLFYFKAHIYKARCSIHFTTAYPANTDPRWATPVCSAIGQTEAHREIGASIFMAAGDCCYNFFAKNGLVPFAMQLFAGKERTSITAPADGRVPNFSTTFHFQDHRRRRLPPSRMAVLANSNRMVHLFKHRSASFMCTGKLVKTVTPNQYEFCLLFVHFSIAFVCKSVYIAFRLTYFWHSFAMENDSLAQTHHTQRQHTQNIPLRALQEASGSFEPKITVHRPVSLLRLLAARAHTRPEPGGGALCKSP